jgi:hypothetical protein
MIAGGAITSGPGSAMILASSPNTSSSRAVGTVSLMLASEKLAHEVADGADIPIWHDPQLAGLATDMRCAQRHSLDNPRDFRGGWAPLGASPNPITA